MWKVAVKGFYLQFLQLRLLRSRQPCSPSTTSCFDPGKCWITVDLVIPSSTK